jgi:hypothetical protein
MTINSIFLCLDGNDDFDENTCRFENIKRKNRLSNLEEKNLVICVWIL